MVARDEEGSAQWTLNALAQAAKEAGIAVKRSQIRRIYLREGVRWRHTHSWGDEFDDPDFVPKEQQVVCHYTEPPEGSTTICTDELGPVVPRTFPPAPGWSATGHRIKAPLDYSRGPEKTWVYGALRVRDGKELTRCAASRNSTNYIALAVRHRSGQYRQATSSSSPTTSPVTAVPKPAPGWLNIPGFITSSFREEPVG